MNFYFQCGGFFKTASCTRRSIRGFKALPRKKNHITVHAGCQYFCLCPKDLMEKFIRPSHQTFVKYEHFDYCGYIYLQRY